MEKLSPTLRFFLITATAAITLFFMRAAAEMINALVLAFVIVFTVTPVLYGLRRRGWPTWLAFAVTLLVVIGTFGALAIVIIAAGKSFVSALPEYTADINNTVESIQNSMQASGSNRLGLDISAVLEAINLSSIFTLIGDFILGLVASLSNIITVAILFVFLLVDATGVPKKIASYLEAGHPIILRLGNYSQLIRRYIGITTIVGLVTGMLDTVLFLVVGVDFALLWGTIAFLFSYIPTIGFWLALIPPVTLAFLQYGLPTALVVFLGIVLINGFAENVVKPKYMGEGLDLSPFMIIFSVMLWAAVLGPLGAILGVPITLAIKVLVLEADEDNRWLVDLMGGLQGKEVETAVSETEQTNSGAENDPSEEHSPNGS